MQPTTLIYSSHNRCEYIHRTWIIERALQSIDNKTIFHIPFSQHSLHEQEYDFNNFKWYYDRFTQWGLNYSVFYWTDSLKKEDIDLFFHNLWHSQVVVLGGGMSTLGIARFKRISEIYLHVKTHTSKAYTLHRFEHIHNN